LSPANNFPESLFCDIAGFLIQTLAEMPQRTRRKFGWPLPHLVVSRCSIFLPGLYTASAGAAGKIRV
jgi:hypothetical protein